MLLLRPHTRPRPNNVFHLYYYGYCNMFTNDYDAIPLPLLLPHPPPHPSSRTAPVNRVPGNYSSPNNAQHE
jgi:hypothetical protein